MYISSIRHEWPEKSGFIISRPNGISEYTFLHFLNPMFITVNGKEYHTKAGACIFISPNTTQLFRSEVDVIHNWAHFSSGFSYKLKEYNIPVDEILFPKDTNYISPLFRNLEQEYFLNYKYREKILDAMTDEFLIKFSRSVLGEAQQTNFDAYESQRISSVRQQILTSPEKNLTVKEIAKMLNLSSSRFHTIYKSMFGTTPMHDIIEARIKRAEVILISNNEISVSQLSEILGYNDQYHFIRQFKQLTGETPAVYRKNRRI